jgi:hypothetical protein
MLSTAQLEHFRTFGFVALRDWLTEHAAPLRAEVDAALRDAYATTYHDRAIDGISGHYLPMASRLTPTSMSLVCDDGRFVDAAEDLLGGPVIPECPEGVLYFAEAGWHNDDGIGVRGVKFATYFDLLTSANGALRFLPGSHHPELGGRLAAYRQAQLPVDTDAKAAAYQASFPGHVVDTAPGDVIAFDLHTWHASVGGRDRLAWTIVYLRCPESDVERERTLRSIHDGFEQDFRGFDKERYPVWRDWLAGAAIHPRRSALIERMRAAGVLDLDGVAVGW